MDENAIRVRFGPTNASFCRCVVDGQALDGMAPHVVNAAKIGARAQETTECTVTQC